MEKNTKKASQIDSKSSDPGTREFLYSIAQRLVNYSPLVGLVHSECRTTTDGSNFVEFSLIGTPEVPFELKIIGQGSEIYEAAKAAETSAFAAIDGLHSQLPSQSPPYEGLTTHQNRHLFFLH